MNEYILDDSVETIEWKKMIKERHLDPSKTYQKLLAEIISCLNPGCVLELRLDYESMKLLLKQAIEFNVPIATQNDLKALFITKNLDFETKERLLIEEGYLEAKTTASIMDPHVYKRVCNILVRNNDISDIQKYRKILLNKLLSDELLYFDIVLNPDKYIHDIQYFYKVNSVERNRFEISSLFYLDLIGEYFFDDYYENAYLDCKQIIKYVNLTNNKLIPEERLSFYENFVNLKDQENKEQYEFFNTYKDIKIMEQFYDDIRALKNESYQSLVDNCTEFTKDSPLYNKALSNKYGCDVYYLDGEEFYGFVRSNVKISKYDVKFTSGKPELEKCPQPTPEEIRRLGHSFTYIGKDDIQTFQDPRSKLTMLYRGINPATIGHIYHNDSWTNPKYEYYSDFQNELHTPESLLQESTKYPEILITELQDIEPIGVVCFDAVTEWDIEFSKKNNIPLVVINTLKYERKYAPENHFVDHYTR